jgi:phenylalanyl-tRNA synthetase beta chain
MRRNKRGLKGLVIGGTYLRKTSQCRQAHLTTVNIDTADPLQIVCGAPNVAGQKVIVAERALQSIL